MKHVLTLLLGMFVTFGFSQKKELKLAQKQFRAEKIDEAKATLATHQALIEGSGETKLITQFNLLSGQIARLQQDFAAAYEYLQKAEGNASIKTTLDSERICCFIQLFIFGLSN